MKYLLLLLFVFPILSFAQCWKYVDSFDNYALAIRNDGTLWGWGYNYSYNLGLGHQEEVHLPQMVEGNNWEKVSAGTSHSMGIKSDGSLWGWGSNYDGQIGTGELVRSGGSYSPKTPYIYPTQIGTETNWENVSASNFDTLILKKDGTIWGMGWNLYGELGVGDNIGRYIPTQIGTDTDWKSVYSLGFLSFGIKKDGTLWVWGSIDELTKFNTPTQFESDTNWKLISKTGLLGLKNDNTVWEWGYFDTETQQYVNKYIKLSNDTDWNPSFVGNLLVKNDGSLWAFGDNTYGQLGDGTNLNKTIFTRVDNNNNWAFASTGYNFSLALKNDGSLWSTGRNQYGQLGDGTTQDRNYFAEISCSNLGVTNFNKQNQSFISPNPTNGIVTVSLKNNETIKKVSVYNNNGSLLVEKTNTNTLDINSLPEGLYLIKIETEQAVYVEKVIKK